MRRLGPDELPHDTNRLARALLGCVLVRDHAAGRTSGRIVETEAYVIDDPASHAYIGERPRTASMFLEPFHAYVYQIYGSYFCVNVTSEAHGQGAAVLVRALEPVDGIEIMRARRGAVSDRDLCRGPGRLCNAMAIDRSLDGTFLLGDGPLWLASGSPPARGAVGRTRRIGITRAAHRELRYFERGNPHVSGPKSLNV